MKQTGTILDDIVAAKKQSVIQSQRDRPQAQLEAELAAQPAFSGPGFFAALKSEQVAPRIIAEVKRASPSAGVLRDPFVLADINQAYQAADKVVAISVITERNYFQGSDETLIYFAAHNDHRKPLLRKDFIFEPYQILESKLLDAQAYLLITSLFDESELAELVQFGLENDIEPLVEVHTFEELAMARQTAARCIGVNSRDLQDFSVDTGTHELLKELPDSYARVAESGINTPERLQAVNNMADAVLIGSQFMRSRNIAAEIEHMTMIGSPT